MATVLWIVLGLFIALLVILAAILLLPVKLRLLAKTVPHPDFRLEVRVLGGLTPAMPITDSERKRTKDKKQKPNKKSGKSNASRIQRMIKAAPDLVVGMLRQFHFEYLNIIGTFGLGDPAATGQLYGRLMPLVYGTPRSEKVFVSLQPDFEKMQLAGTIDTMISVTPATLIPPAVQFAWRSFGPRK